MSVPLLVFFVVASFISAILFLLFGYRNYRLVNRDKRYDILVDFPYDLSFGPNLFSVISRVFFVAFSIATAMTPIILVTGDYLGVTTMAIFLMASLIFYAASGCGILFVSSARTKPHVLSALLYFLFGGFCSFFAGLLFFQFRTDRPGLGWSIAILCWVLCLCNLLILINPKLANWSKMNVVESVDGSYLEKPRPFWLALSEWLAIILHGLLFIILAIGLFILSLS